MIVDVKECQGFDAPSHEAGPAGESDEIGPPPDAHDPIIRLKMPGCYAGRGSLNAPARLCYADYFPELQADKVVICDALDGPNALLDFFCPFERAFAEQCLVGLEKQRTREPRLVAFSFGNRKDSVTYSIFVAHALPLSDGGYVDFRLLPVPASVVQIVTREVYDDRQVNVGHLDSFPYGLSVEVRGKIPVRSGLYRLRSDDRIRLDMTKSVVESMILELDRQSAPEAWRRSAKSYDGLLGHIPAAVQKIFTDGASRAKEIVAQFRQSWMCPFDAPILTNVVLPDVWDHIRADRDLRYLPIDEDEQLQYLRARLSLDELQKQDHYLRWLPLPDAWNHEMVRESLYNAHAEACC